ncbi:Glu-tRNA(Gln) amidotransferase subunit GatD [Candidatus Woesearchaeota archaeon]|nr:Glu-tRNA(Gln) amidotransferase subunit GatD [Candidatus Woesearchaeota archaeon]
MAEPGDIVTIKTQEESIQGMLMPEEKDFAVIKLDTGYNIGIAKKRIKEIQVLHKKKDKKPVTLTIAPQQQLPTISILHTGGTIASKVDYETGGVIARFTPEEITTMFPELKEIANINSRLVSNMWSQDLRFSHYNTLIKEIEKEIKKDVQGIIITHGTDTLHYTSAALAFTVQNSPIPIILVGSQRSSDRGSTDGALNLLCAARFITQTSFAGIAVCMHENTGDENCTILPATKCRKMHTSRRDAFQPINTIPWARVIYPEKKIEFLRTDYQRKHTNKPNITFFKEDLKIAILKQHTNMNSEQYEFYENYDGLVIETTGLGNLPTSEIDEHTKEHSKIFKTLQKLAKKMPVVLAPQTIYGMLNLNVYENQRKLQEIGILGHLSDTTPETTFIKLAWLLSNHDKEETKELMRKNIAGEISERIEQNTFLWHK